MNTPYFINLIAKSLFGTAESNTLPSKYYIGLSTSEPTESGVCYGEPAESTGYNRVMLDQLELISDGVITNTEAITFLEADALWGTMKYYVVYDTPSGGHLLFWDVLSRNVVVDTGHTVTFEPGALVIRIINPEQIEQAELS